MSLIDKNKLLFGAAQNFNDICWVYPLTISEIIGMGEDNYNEYLSYLITNVEDIYKDLRQQKISEEELNFSALDYLLIKCTLDNTFLLKLQKAFFTFIREKVHFSLENKEIVIGENFSQKRILNNDNFSDFQNIIRAQNVIPIPEKAPENESPMARKFRLRREQVAEAKKRQATKNGNSVTLADSIETLICFNIGYSLEDIGKLTVYSFQRLLSRAQLKYRYDLDMRMIAAGADPKKIKPKDWVGKLDL